jgi:DnaJ-domain-containing protein 1
VLALHFRRTHGNSFSYGHLILDDLPYPEWISTYLGGAPTREGFHLFLGGHLAAQIDLGDADSTLPRRFAAAFAQFSSADIEQRLERRAEEVVAVIERVLRDHRNGAPEPSQVRVRPSAPPPSNTPYEILGVDRSATDDEIGHAYRRHVLENHPDKYATAPAKFRELAEEETRRIIAAYRAIRAERDGR